MLLFYLEQWGTRLTENLLFEFRTEQIAKNNFENLKFCFKIDI